MSRPNIVYLHSHDTGRLIGPYGHPASTPHLQRLAEQSVLFRNAHCAAPTCSPSRAALLTGMWAHQTGMLGLAHRGWRMHDYERHLVRFLKKHGYQTALAGIQHEGTLDLVGYDHVIPSAGASYSGQAAAEFIRTRGTGSAPFFLSIGQFQTHRTFPAPAADSPETDPRYVAVPPWLPDTPRTREDMAAFNTMARDMDAQAGAALAALEEAKLTDNTIVLCTTDHGPPMPMAKCNLTSRGTGVLLMLRVPGRPEIRGGAVTDALVSHVDVFPTLCDLIDVPKPDWLVGHSLLPVMLGRAGQVREELFSEVTYHAAYEPQRSIRTRRYTYIRRFSVDAARVVLPNIDRGLSKSEAMESGLADRVLPDEALYDHVADPMELVNLAADPSHQEVLATLRGRLQRWMDSTHDPLLRGPVPLIQGGTVNTLDQVHPNDPPVTSFQPR